MITLTDGTKKVKLTKDEMEMIELAIRDYRDNTEDLGWKKETEEINDILTKLMELDY